MKSTDFQAWATDYGMLTEIETSLVELLDDPLTISGILLYGSWSTGRADPESDFDLICVLQSPWENHRREVKPFAETCLDIYYAPAQVLKRRLQTQNLLNNNFILNGFVEGKILVDRNGVLKELATVAKNVWAKGPERPSRESVLFVQQQFRATLYSIQRSVLRADNSPEYEGLARLRCSELFSRMVYEYCHRKGVWTSSMPRVCRWAQANCPELYKVAHNYLLARSNEDMVQSLNTILDLLEKNIPDSTHEN